LRGLFVTGTDTEVGKTVVAAALCAALIERGASVAAFKPAVTGLDEPPAPEWPRDHELLGQATGQSPSDVAPYLFGPPVSPHYAAELAGSAIEPPVLLQAARQHELLIAEGVGGLMVPLTPGYLVRDLAVDLGLPLVVVARTGLGTINHTLLTLQAARAYGLDVRAVVITPWPEQPSRLEQSNLEAIRRFGFVEVDTLARAESAETAELARIGCALPWQRWLGERPPVSEPASTFA
jgi:dethiobiotin synthetase